MSKQIPVVCVETRHMQALLKAQINKTDQLGVFTEFIVTLPRRTSAPPESATRIDR